jgi:hypothetical protein
MDIRILDLDGSICRQEAFARAEGNTNIPLQEWGTQIRLACGFGLFQRFEKALAHRLGSAHDRVPQVTLFGSGDFHHVSLALLRRLRGPINLLVIDNHPDWMRGVPFMHCGTWLLHAARLPCVDRIFHVGGDVDFDNYFQWLAPWQELRAGKIRVFPARRRFVRGAWQSVVSEPVRKDTQTPATADQVARMFRPFRDELARCPLYISVDKDVMPGGEAVVNWDSGHLTLAEVKTVIRVVCGLSNGNLAGFDTTGDWSPVRLRGLLGRLMHWTEHPRLDVTADEANRRNGAANLALLRGLEPAALCA